MNSRVAIGSGVCIAAAGVWFVVSAFHAQESSAAPRAEPSSSVVLTDRPIAAHRTELLDLAFKAASAFPLDPHVKDRSRNEEAVVGAAFELEQPTRALRYLEQMPDWRRGKACADYAFYCAKHGDTARVQEYLDRADQIATESAKSEDSQDWQIDSIRISIAKAQFALGHVEKAHELRAGAADFVATDLDALEARSSDEQAMQRELEALDAAAANSSFDATVAAMQSCARLYDRFYSEAALRDRIEDRIQADSTRVPVMIRIDTFGDLARVALDHGDRSKAFSLVEQAKQLADGSIWNPEDQIPLIARLAALRHRAGDSVRALHEVNEALALYESKRDRIVDIYRAGALRPVAEALHALGDSAKARAIYARAAEEAVVNPNSRPRADDLVAICCSMARNEVEPDAALRARLAELVEHLGPPW